jgi:magnesium-transporting ATPase (P-type)
MGVKIKMVTGDALAIAQETAKKLDMGTAIHLKRTCAPLSELLRRILPLPLV